jgi:hypothetical protein
MSAIIGSICKDEKDLKSVAKNRSMKYVKKSIESRFENQYIKEGWEIERRKCTMRSLRMRCGLYSTI